MHKVKSWLLVDKGSDIFSVKYETLLNARCLAWEQWQIKINLIENVTAMNGKFCWYFQYLVYMLTVTMTEENGAENANVDTLGRGEYIWM